MFKSFRTVVFGLYEQALLRNWFYTLAFVIVVPTGFRFAVVSWEHGAWFDKPLAIIAGTAIGVTAVVTLLRVWEVPPRQIVSLAPAHESATTPAGSALSLQDVLSGSRRQAAVNLQMAREAATLGSTRRR